MARAFAEPQEKAASKNMMRSIQIIEGPHQDGWEAKAKAKSTIRDVPYQTFEAFLERIKGTVTPTRVDTSVR